MARWPALFRGWILYAGGKCDGGQVHSVPKRHLEDTKSSRRRFPVAETLWLQVANFPGLSMVIIM